MTELTLEQIAENVRLWQWREETGGVLQQRHPGALAWSGSCTTASASYVTSRIYRKAPQPQVRWVNFAQDQPAAFMHLTDDGAQRGAKGDPSAFFAIAVPVSFPPGTFPESDDE